MFQHGANLLEGDARKPLNELGDLRAILQILEQRGNWDPGTDKYPCAPNPTWVALDGSTCRPINHRQIVPLWRPDG
jgi:hypothetical protein